MSDERLNSDNQSGEWMKDAFRSWDAGEPADGWEEIDASLSRDTVWNKLDRSLETEERSADSWMQEAHTSWDAGTPADGWNVLAASLISADSHPDEWIQTAHNDWETGLPVADWAKLDASLDAAELSRDHWMREAHNSWDAGTPADQWPVINDALSVEKVWTGLYQSLNAASGGRFRWRVIAATLVALMVIGSLNDMPFPSADQDPPVRITAAEQVASEPIAKIPVTQETAVGETRVSNQQNRARKMKPNAVTPGPEIVQNPENTANNIPVYPQEVVPANDLLVVAPDLLERKNLGLSEKELQSLRIDPPRHPYHQWTLQMGAQLAFLPEKDQPQFTSMLPKFGLTADLIYRHRIRSVELVYAFGVCQYAQQTGKFVNGRYSTLEQHLSAMQLSGAAAYSYRRFTAFGGPFVTKVLSGLEQKSNTIIKLYNFNSLQLGLVGGIDYKVFASPRTGKHISVGVQYQWIPRPLGQNTSFDNIQSLRLQAKFSF